MYVHSVKVPRLYKDAAKVLQKVKEDGGSVKKLIFETKHCNKKGLCALVNETLRRYDAIDTLIDKIHLLSKETRFNPWLARILITELLWGKKHLPDQSLPLKTLLTYKPKLEKYNSQLFDSITNEKTNTKVNKPRVVRVNTILTTVENAVNELKNEEWRLIPFAGSSYEEFVSQTALLKDSEFMVDLHFKELLQFPSNTEFHKYKGYRNGSLVLQDKASCLPALLLNPEPGSIVLDMCAAPGMKTTHLAALLKNQGSVFAVERDEKRFKTLNEMVTKLGATCVKTINKDVLKVTEKDCHNVKYILVDPSCSGSGMTDRVEFKKDTLPLEERLKKLSGFQILILKHALKNFPDAQRVVYSTCSIYPKENEFVVQEVLKNDVDFKLVNAHEILKGAWRSNNSEETWQGITENCLSMKPEKDLTNGFFVAVFERTRDSAHKKTKTNKAKDKQKTKDHEQESVATESSGKLESASPEKKSKKHNQRIESTMVEDIVPESAKKSKKRNNFETSTPHNKKSKKHNDTENLPQTQIAEGVQLSNTLQLESGKKGKKLNNLDAFTPQNKKSKKHNNSAEDLQQNETEGGELLAIPQLESGKKTKKNNDLETVTPKTKKSKKHNDTENLQHNETGESVQSSDTVQLESIKKAKKHKNLEDFTPQNKKSKKHNDSSEDLQQNQTAGGQLSTSQHESGKKTKKQNDLEIVTPKNKKSKKHNNSSSDNFHQSQTTEGLQLEASPELESAKKRNKRNNLETPPLENKKFKKHNNSTENLQDITLNKTQGEDDFNKSETSAKKKKNRKSKGKDLLA